ncbi:MAG: hypothetical protein BWX92_03710 [Deltaproteobacteria bacterium ADurb.Bin135]|jgi:hypothetical protein|nr:MAG: hypothetical protein BWX92_03710 [Deltaproteobacteria bacterium ADurb.Bin135]
MPTLAEIKKMIAREKSELFNKHKVKNHWYIWFLCKKLGKKRK